MTTRREFLAASAAAAALSAVPAFAAEPKKPKLKKAVKYGMIGVKGTPTEKFNLIKKLGFQGVEIDSPSNLKLDEVVAATKETGIVVHGVIDSVHWTDTLSQPDGPAGTYIDMQTYNADQITSALEKAAAE